MKLLSRWRLVGHFVFGLLIVRFLFYGRDWLTPDGAMFDLNADPIMNQLRNKRS